MGRDLAHLSDPPTRVHFDNEVDWKMGGRWIEAVHKVAGRRLYMWYHNEPHHVLRTRPDQAAPRIGQMYSDDNGLNWHDQGVILEAAADTFAPDTLNRYFVGGHGDCSVIADRTMTHFYFLISTYNRDTSEQGVAIARMACADIEHPVGKVTKWYNNSWSEPGIAGHVTPIFYGEVDWHKSDARAYWGPSVHWNSYLNEYVLLMNKAIDGNFPQEGVYISFNARLDDPGNWTPPQKILDVRDWYPQVVGTGSAVDGTDRAAGRVSRLFVKGRSVWELAFEQTP